MRKRLFAILVVLALVPMAATAEDKQATKPLKELQQAFVD